jgi:hypothetical protein
MVLVHSNLLSPILKTSATLTAGVGELGHLHTQHTHDLVTVGSQTQHNTGTTDNQDPAAAGDRGGTR